MTLLPVQTAFAVSSLLLLLYRFRSRRRLRRRRCVRPLIALRIEAPDGLHHGAELDPEPFSVGFGSDCDLDLSCFREEGSGRQVADTRLRITPEAGGLRVEGRDAVLLDGVRRRRGRIVEGGFIRLGNLKIVYPGIIEREEFHPVPASPRYGLLVTAGLLLLSTLLIGFIPRSGPGSAAVSRPVPPPAAEEQETGSGRALRSFAPGDPLPSGTVDLLFIHAHPDDESIDGGALLSLAARHGLRTAVVLMTDGESGIYGSGYRGPRDNLARLRVAEAEAALTLLQADYYIRIGLPNHPYNSSEEELSASEIIDRWGGAERIGDTLENIIARLMPLVVVSPDGPASAREHFEHEATGLLVGALLDRLDAEDGFRPAAYLTVVDPRQRGGYGELLELPRETVRDLQKRALRAHATQADASVFGVEMIEEFDYEYYDIKYWRLNAEPTEYLLP